MPGIRVTLSHDETIDLKRLEEAQRRAEGGRVVSHSRCIASLISKAVEALDAAHSNGNGHEAIPHSPLKGKPPKSP